MKEIMKNVLEEISIGEFTDIKIGHVQDNIAMTGVTAIVFGDKAVAGVEISGGGPASRETPLLDPKMACDNINCIVLSGGSAFGLEAGVGAAKWLEEQGIGFETGYGKVPLVCQSCIFDLSLGKQNVRPDMAMGYEACKNAIVGNAQCGNVGGGTGATVGKLMKMKQSMKSGLGIHAVKLGNLKVAAIVIVNALGDIVDFDNGEKIAGMLTLDRKEFMDIEQTAYFGALQEMNDIDNNHNEKSKKNKKERSTNTTIGAIITNADFSKADMNKIAKMATVAYSKCIRPAATTADGDTLYAVSTGKEKADINLVGMLSARVMGEAIKKAVELSRMDEKEYVDMCLEMGEY